MLSFVTKEDLKNVLDIDILELDKLIDDLDGNGNVMLLHNGGETPITSIFKVRVISSICIIEKIFGEFSLKLFNSIKEHVIGYEYIKIIKDDRFTSFMDGVNELHELKQSFILYLNEYDRIDVVKRKVTGDKK